MEVSSGGGGGCSPGKCIPLLGRHHKTPQWHKICETIPSTCARIVYRYKIVNLLKLLIPSLTLTDRRGYRKHRPIWMDVSTCYGNLKKKASRLLHMLMWLPVAVHKSCMIIYREGVVLQFECYTCHPLQLCMHFRHDYPVLKCMLCTLVPYTLHDKIGSCL